jgi:Tfp pilus assembly protein PilO
VMRPGRLGLLITLGGLVLLNGVVYGTFTLPRTLQRRNLDQRLKAAQAEVERERQRMDALRAHFDLINANNRDTTEFFNRRIGRRDATMVPLLRDIEALARARGLKVASQGYGVEQIKGMDVERFEVKMPLRGSYREVLAFVEELERSSRFVTLDQITAHVQPEGEIEVQLVLSCYFRSPAVKAGA